MIGMKLDRAGGGLLGERIRDIHSLEDIAVTVAPTGEIARFAAVISGMDPFIVEVPLDKMGGLLREINSASCQMINRQRLSIDRGSSQMLELCHTAQRPDGYQLLHDPLTDDLIFCFQFRNHAPVVLRTELGLAMENMAHTMRYLKAAAH